MFKNIYNYREFFKTSVSKEFRGKYKKSALGVLWSFINPLLQILVYSVVFSFITRSNIDNYTIFLIVGLIPWNFFSNTIMQSTPSIVINGGIIKKIYFPREILPISVVTSNLINFLISCLIIVIALFISGIGITRYALFFPLILLLQYLFLIGMSLVISSVTVYIRDLEHFVNVLLMLWLYATPVLYEASLIPVKLQTLFKLNPMYHIIGAYRDILYYQVLPDFKDLGIMFIVCTIFFMFGYSIFKKLEKRFAEEL